MSHNEIDFANTDMPAFTSKVSEEKALLITEKQNVVRQYFEKYPERIPAGMHRIGIFAEDDNVRLDQGDINYAELCSIYHFVKVSVDINSKTNTIDWLLNVDSSGASLKDYATEDEQAVALTVIRWLGSNVGFSHIKRFLDDAGYEIVKK